MTITPENVWVVRVSQNDLSTYYYAAVDSEGEARNLVEQRVSGAEITGVKSVKNVDGVDIGGFNQVPEGEYNGPLIPYQRVTWIYRSPIYHLVEQHTIIRITKTAISSLKIFQQYRRPLLTTSHEVITV